MFAAVVIVFLPTFILYIFLSEKIIAGVTGGGVKGNVCGALPFGRALLYP